jgi:hypothetical protein
VAGVVARPDDALASGWFGQAWKKVVASSRWSHASGTRSASAHAISLRLIISELSLWQEQRHNNSDGLGSVYIQRLPTNIEAT